MKSLKKFGVGLMLAASFAGVGTAPIIPVGNGIISIAVFEDAKGQQVREKIPDAIYKRMGEKEGQQYNPKKEGMKWLYSLQQPVRIDYSPEFFPETATSSAHWETKSPFVSQFSDDLDDTTSIIKLITPKADAAIARDATSHTYDQTGTATSLTVSHTITGSNPILIAGLIHRGNEALTSSTYNGAALTAIGRAFNTNNGVNMYGIMNPDTGAHNLVASWTTASVAMLLGESYTGVGQSGQPDSFNTGTADATSLAVSTTVPGAGTTHWLVGMSSDDGAPFDPTAGAGTSVNVQEPYPGGAWNGNAGLDSNGTVSFGSQSLAVNATFPGTNIAMVVASIDIFIAAAGASYLPMEDF